MCFGVRLGRPGECAVGAAKADHIFMAGFSGGQRTDADGRLGTDPNDL